MWSGQPYNARARFARDFRREALPLIAFHAWAAGMEPQPRYWKEVMLPAR